MKVKDVMTSDVLSVRPETTLKEVATVLVEHSISGVPVCDADGSVVGVVSEGDILFKERGAPRRRGGPLGWLVSTAADPSFAKAEARTAVEAMTSPAFTIEPDRSLTEAARLMTDKGVNRLPVVYDGALVGIVTRADLVRAFHRSDDQIAEEIREEVFKRALWIDPESLELEVSEGEVMVGGHVEAHTDARVLEKLLQRVPGVVSVRCLVTWTIDDMVRRPVGPMGKRI